MQVFISGSVSYDILLATDNSFTRLLDNRSSSSLSVGFHVDSLHTSYGGPAANIAFHLARAGVEAAPIAAVGGDFAPYRRWLSEHGVELSGVHVEDSQHTPRAYIQSDCAQNQILAFYTGAMRFGDRCRLPDGRPALCLIGPDDRSAQRKRLDEFVLFDCPVIFDPGQSITALEISDLDAALDVCSLMIVNDFELHFAETKLGVSREELIRRLNEGLIVTRGADGAEFLSASERFSVPAVPCSQPVDPTGCGDAFRAGLIEARLRGASMRRAMAAGSALASKTLAVLGGQGQCLAADAFLL